MDLSFVASVVACVEFGVSLLQKVKNVRRYAETVTSRVASIEDELEQLSGHLKRFQEQCARLKDDPCVTKHSEVTTPLLDTQDTASDFARRLRAIQAGWTSLDDEMDTLGRRKMQEQLNWILPAADMLEDSFQRLWLHLHLVRDDHNKHKSDGTSSITENGDMDLDEHGKEDFPGWIDLRPISVVADFNDYGHHDAFERSTSAVNYLTLVVGPKCRVWEQEAAIWHGNPEVKGGQARSRSMIKVRDQHSPSRSAAGGVKTTGSCQSPQQGAKGGQDRPRQIIGAPSRMKDKSADEAWLFSDQWDPATVRPMFGCLLRRYKASNSLHLSRVNALSRIDVVLELPPRKGDGMKGWLLDQSASLGSDEGRSKVSEHESPIVRRNISAADVGWPPVWEAVLPRNDLERHFALRAAYCVTAAIRPLSPDELFAASKTVARPEDHKWPWEEAAHLFEVTKWLLEVDNDNTVRFRSRDLEKCTPQTAREAHAFLARVCLTHLQDMEQRIVIWPWSRYIELKGNVKRYPLHDYVTNAWQHHYCQAELYVPDMPRQLHRLIEGAWLAERTEPSKRDGTGAEVDLDAYNEALDVGLILCESYGFQKLKSAYINMGARKHELKNKNAFDFNSWHSVGPLNPPSSHNIVANT